MRLLRLPPREPHGTHHPHTRADRGRVPCHKEARTIREHPARHGRASCQGRCTVSCESHRHREALLLEHQDRGHALRSRRVQGTDKARAQWRHLLPGDLPQGQLPALSSPRHEVALRVAMRRLRPYGAGGCALHRHGRTHWTGKGVAHGRHHDGSPPALPAEALLAHEVQHQLPPNATCTERRLPAQLHHDGPPVGTGHLCHAHLRPRR